MPFSPKLIRIARRLLVGLAVIVTLIAIAVAIENWRGDRAWRRYVQNEAIPGINLTELPQPTKLPAQLNFMKTPTLDRLLWEKIDSAVLRDFYAQTNLPKSPLPKLYAWTKGIALDLKQCAEQYTAVRKTRGLPEVTASTPAETLVALQKNAEPILEELRNAARERADSQLARPVPMNPENPFGTSFVSYQTVRAIMLAQTAHACASLHNQQPEVAFLDTLAALKLSRGLAEAPDAVLVETMISTATVTYPLQPLWEGLRNRDWNDTQLESLGSELAKANLVNALDRSLQNERIAANLLMDQIGHENPAQFEIKKMMILPFRVLFTTGWIQQNKVRLNQWSDRVHEALANHGSPKFLSMMQHMDDIPTGGKKQFPPYSFLVAEIMPAHIKITQNVLQKQAYLTLALSACALERHRLAHGSYPETLAELVPAYLDKVPVDLIDGQPLRYHRTDNGKFLLYSIGLDGKDDGGKPVNSGDVNSPGDWIWPQPATTGN